MSFNSNEPWVTPEDYSSVPAVISWFMGTTCVLCVFVKFTTKIAMKRAFSKDDVAILVAMLFSAGFIASISVATSNGVGVPQRMLSPAQIEAVEKSVYAADLMYITTLFFSKTAVLLLFRALTPIRLHRAFIWIVGGIVGAWVLSSLFVVAFQCSMPHRWSFIEGSCVNQTAFWTYSGALNIITELCICLLPLIMFSTLQMHLSTKVTINMMFLLRVLFIAPVTGELYFRHHLNPRDQTGSLWPVLVCMTITQALGIVFGCTPFLKPFFAALETGMVRLDDTRRLSATTLVSNSNGKASRSLLPQTRRSGRSRSRSQSQKRKASSHNSKPSIDHFDFNFSANGSQGWTEIGRGSPLSAPMINTAAQEDIENNIYQHPANNDSAIVATTTFEVRYAGDRFGSLSGEQSEPTSLLQHRSVEQKPEMEETGMLPYGSTSDFRSPRRNIPPI